MSDKASSNVEGRPQAKAKSSVESGHVNIDFPKTLGGYPDTKDVEQIDKVNRPKKAPGSVRA